MSGILLDEYELLGEARYRSYISAIDKALKNFEYTSEWADLISALGKLNKVILNNVKYPVIPRRIIISKRLAQCMHPALPSGVHLKALETYDIIFKCIGPKRLSQELFIYSAGLFPLLGNAAMTVKPSLLTIYENHFVPLGEKLRPGLNGFLVGVLPGLEEGSEYYDRTDELLVTICNNVEKSFFYGCMWRCILSNPTIRLPAVTFIINHYNRRISMEDQLYFIGTDIDTMVQGLCASLQDSSVLVQRCALDLLLLGFPIHSNQLVASDMVQVVTSALTVVLRRDMSLNRRLFSWLMGSSSLKFDELNKSSARDLEKTDKYCYFKQYSKEYLLKALQVCFDNPQAVMASSNVNSNADLWCYRLLISLLDRPEISYIILDDILIDIFRSLYLACNSPNFKNTNSEKRHQKNNKDKNELKKAANLLFAGLEPSYLWEYSARFFEIASQSSSVFLDLKEFTSDSDHVQKVGSGNPTLIEFCTLVSFLLDVVSLETYLEAKTEHLPKLLCSIFDVLTHRCKTISVREISIALKLCSKLLCKIQPPLIKYDADRPFENGVASGEDDAGEKFCDANESLDGNETVISCEDNAINFSDSSETNLFVHDDTLNGTSPSDIFARSVISVCEEKFQSLVVTFIKEKMICDFTKSFLYYQSLILPKEGGRLQREKRLDGILKRCLTFKKIPPSEDEILQFKKEIYEDVPLPTDRTLPQTDYIVPNHILCQAFEQLSHLLKELSSIPTFYTNSKELYDAHMKSTQSSTIPDWLKLMVSLVCFVKSEEIFFPATAALFDLIALTKSALHNNEINEVACVSPVPSTISPPPSTMSPPPSTMSPPPLAMSPPPPTISPAPSSNNGNGNMPSTSTLGSSSSTVILVAFTPAISFSQLEFLSYETLLFDVTAQKLWQYVGDDRANYCSYATELLQQVHNLSPSDSVCEAIICQAMSSQDEMEQVEAQKKFSILWHVTRDSNGKTYPATMTRVFDRCLFLMLDNLGRETGPQKAISQAWLNHSLQRGDIARFLEPILLILLHPDSARVSVQHVNVHRPRKVVVTDHSARDQREDVEAKVYAISSISGNIIYHISDESHPSSAQVSPEKKILALTSVVSVDSGKGSTVVTSNSMLQDFELPSSHERGLKLPISLFVNPFGSLSSLGSDSQLDYTTFSPPDLSQAKRIENGKKSSFDDDIGEENDPDAELSIEQVVACVVDDIVSQVANETLEKDFISSGDFNFNDDYSEYVLTSTCNLNDSLVYPLPEFTGMPHLTVHPLHTYILLYCQVYDFQKTLYALYSLKAIILTNPRITLCSMATTNVSNSLSSRGQHIQILLARHRKSVFGNNFHGELAPDATTMFRSNTYVEIIVVACLYHIRSHYPNLPHVRLTDDDIFGNQNVRLLCMEVLTLVFSELVGIVKDSGKSFASYLSDLLNRSKVQKTLLHCLAASVYDSQPKSGSDDEKNITFTENIVEFNERSTRRALICFLNIQSNEFQDTYQVHLLRLMATLIVLEDTVLSQNGSEKDNHNGNIAKSPDPGSEKKSNIRLTTSSSSSKYQPGIPIPCQSMFLSAVLTALRLEHHAHLHIHWLSLVTSALPFVSRWLPRLVMTVVHQLCGNLEAVTTEFWTKGKMKEQIGDAPSADLSLPPDYLITVIEGLTTLCHYCLLECPAPVLSPLNQPPLPPVPSQPYAPGTSASQIISNLIHVFSTSSSQKDVAGRENGSTYDPILSARRVLLSNLPNVLASISSIYCIVKEADKQESEKRWGIMGTPKVVKQHILSFLSPISLNHGPNFMAAIAVIWNENKSKKVAPTRKVIPVWSKKQLLIVELVAAIKVLPLESIVQIVRTVLKQPPPISSKVKVAIEVNTLQFFLAYVQQTSGSQLIETWPSLLGLWRDGLQLSSPLVQFHLLAILHEFVLRSPLLEDKKSQKDLQDIAHKLIEACSSVACDSLEQTTWLWRNLAVKPGPQSDISSVMEEGNDKVGEGKISSDKTSQSSHSNIQYSVQALCSLAEFLAPVLDFVYVGEEKEKVVPLLSNIMHYVTPYLKNHSLHNVPSFRACCQLLADISGYQHTRKAWRREAFELLLDSSFFQMNSTCIGYWRSIIDHLMTHDKTTFRDFMSRVSVAQSGSLNLFSSKEQEYEQRAHLLKRLAFVIFCSETDQYQKYMPDIQERLTESLRMSHVPVVQAQIFLCFRVLLIRMSPHHVTSLWPVIITEMVQIFTQIEYDLCSDSEEFSDGVGLRKTQSFHIRRISTLDTSWVVSSANGLNAHNHPAWLHLYLSVCKLLDMTVALPANILPQFQMYRWAFIGDSPPLSSEFDSVDKKQTESEFVPHIMRLANLLNKKVPSDECLQYTPGQVLLTIPSINSILQLQPFFNTLSSIKSQSKVTNEKTANIKHTKETTASPMSKSKSAPDLHSLLASSTFTQGNTSKSTIEQIELILETDFLEPYVQ